MRVHKLSFWPQENGRFYMEVPQAVASLMLCWLTRYDLWDTPLLVDYCYDTQLKNFGN